jgi:CheY-like chemotaxis protein
MSAWLEDDLWVAPHVLVVDDDEAFRGLAARLLATFGIGEVVQAGTVAAALETAERLEPVAALVDVGLPDGDGVDLALRLAAAPWRPRVVLTSSDPEAAAHRGSLPFLSKGRLADDALRSLLTGEE